jgi:hypothetical protein
LGFHTTFIPKKEDLTKILNAASESQGLNDTTKNLQMRTGLGNKKVGPMKSWAIRSGLVNKEGLTPAGKIIIEYDPFLTSLVTEWFMHFHLCFGEYGLASPPATADEWGGWTYFIFEYLANRSQFTLDSLTESCLATFDEDNANAVKKNLRVLLRTYTESDAIAQLQIIKQTNKKENR